MYKILRVPPNKDSYARAYEIMIGWLGVDKSQIISFGEFYNRVDTIYMIVNSDDFYVGMATVAFGVHTSSLPFLNGQCWKLSILTFDDSKPRDPERYKKVYDLIYTTIRDKKDKPIILEGVDNEEHFKDVVNALKNNKFRRHQEKNGLVIWYLIPSRFDGLEETKVRHINPNKDEDVLDQYVHFPDDYKDMIPEPEKEDGYVEIHQPKEYCRHPECKGCEFFSCCSPTDKCRLFEDK